MHQTALDVFVAWMAHYGYFVLFPIAAIEGPVITIIAGFLVGQGEFNFWAAYAVVIAGDLAGDLWHYYLGRWGKKKPFGKVWRWLGITEERVRQVEGHFKKHSGKTLLIGKFAHGVGGVGLVAAGFAEMPLARFLWWNFLGTLAKSLILIGVGYEFGQSYNRIGKYLDYTAIIAIVLGLVLGISYFVLARLSRKMEDGD